MSGCQKWLTRGRIRIEMAEQYDMFICYSRRNSRFVKRLTADLAEHHVSVWMDTIALEVGDLFHQKIEEAIENSRYFCLVMSPPALTSYYVRQVEIETAFSKVVRTRNDSFILPILYQPISEPLPGRLASRQHLNFTNSPNYNENVAQLVKKVKLSVDDFTGQRWYKAFEISPFGQIVGISELSQAAPTGPSVHILYHNGTVQKIEIYQNATMVNYKRFTFDSDGRVHENMMYGQGKEPGTWQYIDTWRYYYDSLTGRRIRKVIDKPGARSRREQYYDGHNRLIEERIVTLDGPVDTSYGYTRKFFIYSPDGHVERETWVDAEGIEISQDLKSSMAS